MQLRAGIIRFASRPTARAPNGTNIALFGCVATQRSTYIAPTCAAVGCVVATIALLGCSAERPHRVQTSGTRTARLALRTAFDVPSATLSCQIGAFCREDVVPAGPTHDEMIEEATEDCARRGGKSAPSACARTGVVASCALSSEGGSISVFAYAQKNDDDRAEAVSTMSDRCDDLGGSFQLAADAR
jgi:hypothetical protein